MPADVLFWVGLLLKMALTASIVVTASVVAERTSAFVGAIIAALPTAAGAAYTILAFEHPPEFISASAVGSIAANSAVALFALVYAWLAPRHGLVFSLGSAILVWLICAAALQSVTWTLTSAILLTTSTYCVTVFVSRSLRANAVAMRRTQPGRFDILVRAAIVGLFVAIVTTLSHRIGSFASGMFAIFPVAMASFVAILHPRIGGAATGAVLAHAQAPLYGLVPCFVAVHLLTESAGVWWAYLAGLAASVAWNVMLWLWYRARMAR